MFLLALNRIFDDNWWKSAKWFDSFSKPCLPQMEQSLRIRVMMANEWIEILLESKYFFYIYIYIIFNKSPWEGQSRSHVSRRVPFQKYTNYPRSTPTYIRDTS